MTLRLPVTLLALLFQLISLLACRAQQAVPLRETRKASLGSVLTVRGVVANGPELGGVRYLMDQTAGLAAYSTTPAFAALLPGDSVELRDAQKLPRCWSSPPSPTPGGWPSSGPCH